MHDTDREAFIAASRILKPLGVPLLDAVKSFATASVALQGAGSLLDAATDYVERHKMLASSKAVAEVVAELLAVRDNELEKGRASLRDVQSLRSHLNRFAAFAKVPIHQVQADTLNDWLRSITTAPKTWNNLRTSLVRLFNFARERRYVPQNARTPADMVKRLKLADSDVATLAPGTLRTLLASADDEGRLYLALGAWTGMRSAELQRLHWQHIDFAAGVIRLPKEVTKTKRKRQIPILPNLRAWLEPFKGSTGKVFSSEKATDRTIAFVKAQGIEWPDNWARHSYGSYRATVTKSIGQVAMELGNSETIVKRHYFDAFANEKDALEWFAIMPAEKTGNVIPMKARVS
jgi:integrase